VRRQGDNPGPLPTLESCPRFRQHFSLLDNFLRVMVDPNCIRVWRSWPAATA
jgi:hypothetical protein